MVSPIFSPTILSTSSLRAVKKRTDISLVFLSSLQNSKLFPYHIDDSKPCDFSSPIGERISNNSDLEQPTIKNISGEKWVSSLPGETPHDILPGEKLNLITGTQIYFGKKKGIIRI